MLYTGRKEIKSAKGNEYKINEGKAIKELDLLEKEIEKYVSIVRRNRKSNIREWCQVINTGLIIKQVF